MRAAEDQLLTSYGWVDQSKGIVRVPINRAIDMLASAGLPSRPQRRRLRPPMSAFPPRAASARKSSSPAGRSREN